MKSVPNQYGVYPPVYSPGRKVLENFEKFRGCLCWNDHRHELVNELESLINIVKDPIGIRAAWIGGSFLTEKDHPDDIDVTFILDGTKVENIPEDSVGLRKLITAPGLKDLANRRGLRIDPYVVVWKPAIKGLTPDTDDYHRWRGYWDDFWQRQRQGEKESEPDLSWTLPRQGYVEVIVNGYQW
ncbi:DUF6932 family protein [Corynebacterium halotolerans]|uniref:DUF6932 family protein n=1 Tax=Corynebacterium halotolerans TaxID=225326 RepID=UPI003CF44D17